MELQVSFNRRTAREALREHLKERRGRNSEILSAQFTFDAKMIITSE